MEYVRTADVKDQIELSGNDIQAVSMTGEEPGLLCRKMLETFLSSRARFLFFYFALSWSSFRFVS